MPAGTVLKGLSFMKNKPDVVAMEDGEYPNWLWGILEEVDGTGGQGKEGGEGDLFCMFLSSLVYYSQTILSILLILGRQASG